MLQGVTVCHSLLQCEGGDLMPVGCAQYVAERCRLLQCVEEC